MSETTGTEKTEAGERWKTDEATEKSNTHNTPKKHTHTHTR